MIRETSTENFGIFKGNPVLNEILVSLINHTACIITESEVLPPWHGKCPPHSIQRLIRAISQKKFANFHFNGNVHLPTFLNFYEIMLQTVFTKSGIGLIE